MAGRPLTEERKPDRRMFLCTGEVADEARRSRLTSLLQDHGDHLQGLIFVCALTAAEQASLASDAATILDETEDQLLLVDFGPELANWTHGLGCVGRTWSPPVRSRIV